MNRRIWSFPWKYQESFVIAFGILLTGIVMEIMLPSAGIFIPSWPGNLYLLIVILGISALLIALQKNSQILKWLGSGYAAIGLSSAFTLLVIIMGLIPQQPAMGFHHRMGLTNINASWPFYLTGLAMVFSLFLITAQRMKKWSYRNGIFILNHLGMIIILLAGGLGKSDFRELTMTLNMDKPVWYAKNANGAKKDLDFALEMTNFDIRYHLPVIQVYNRKGKIVKSQEIDTAVVKQKFKYKKSDIIVEKVMQEAIKMEEQYKAAEHPSAVSAIKLKINQSEEDTVAWISSGSRMMSPPKVEFDNFSLGLRRPSPKIYETTAQLYSKQGRNEKVNIKVNHPVKVNDWKIYQTSYDQSMGRYSKISILTLVKDPWLWVVYAGIFMLITGALGLFLYGKSYKIKPKQE
ncbi:MAG: cytochrome c biogenesis protein ResB [Bacteroidales bacterium]